MSPQIHVCTLSRQIMALMQRNFSELHYDHGNEAYIYPLMNAERTIYCMLPNNQGIVLLNSL